MNSNYIVVGAILWVLLAIAAIILSIIYPPLAIPLFFMNKRRISINKTNMDKEILRFLEKEMDNRFWMKEQEKREASVKHNRLGIFNLISALMCKDK